MRKLALLCIILSFTACSENEPAPFTPGNANTLSGYLAESDARFRGNVIACSASDKLDASIVYTFYYPLPNVTNPQYFELNGTLDEVLDSTKYTVRALPQENVFNGYLKRYVRGGDAETFSTVTYERGDTLYVAEPIRFKQNSKPTVWNDSVNIAFDTPLEPTFTWTDQGITDNIIYFQVISDADGNLLSGTYTVEKTFTYYKTDNLVLNVTRNTPPPLEAGKTYRFTLMAVSDDNWVNTVIQKDFSL